MKTASLHRNEMPYNIPADLRHIITTRINRAAFNVYPEPFAESLAIMLAKYYGCTKDQIMVAPGSSAFIRLLITRQALCHQGSIVLANPSFPYYMEYCEAFGIPYREWPLDSNLRYDLSSLPTLSPGSLILFANPNNPTGELMTEAVLKKLLDKASNSFVVVDEAYIEFGGRSAVRFIDSHPNLIILRTLSKSLSSAGVRCGSLIANSAIIRQLLKLQTPFQLSTLSIEAVKAIIEYDNQNGWLGQRVKSIQDEREYLLKRISRNLPTNWQIPESKGNFLFIKAPNNEIARSLVDKSREIGLTIADISGMPRLEGCVRITIGRRSDNKKLLQAMQQTVLLS